MAKNRSYRMTCPFDHEPNKVCRHCGGTGEIVFDSPMRRCSAVPERWMQYVFRLAPTPMEAQRFLKVECGELLSLERACNLWFAEHGDAVNDDSITKQKWDTLNQAIHVYE